MVEFKLEVHKQTRLVHYDNWGYELWVGRDGFVIDYLEYGKVRESHIVTNLLRCIRTGLWEQQEIL